LCWVLRTFFLNWLQTAILLIAASLVARIIDINHRHLAQLVFWDRVSQTFFNWAGLPSMELGLQMCVTTPGTSCELLPSWILIYNSLMNINCRLRINEIRTRWRLYLFHVWKCPYQEQTRVLPRYCLILV
jgi:hypothetical protein